MSNIWFIILLLLLFNFTFIKTNDNEDVSKQSIYKRKPTAYTEFRFFNRRKLTAANLTHCLWWLYVLQLVWLFCMCIGKLKAKVYFVLDTKAFLRLWYWISCIKFDISQSSFCRTRGYSVCTKQIKWFDPIRFINAHRHTGKYIRLCG